MTDIPCSPASGRDPDLWFSAKGSEESREAKRLCMDCPLYFPCAESAIRDGVPFGIFGGMDERERAAIWRRNGGKPTKFLEDIDAAVGIFTNTFVPTSGEAA